MRAPGSIGNLRLKTGHCCAPVKPVLEAYAYGKIGVHRALVKCKSDCTLKALELLVCKPF